MAQSVEKLPYIHEVVGSGPTGIEFFYIFVPTLAYSVGTRLSYLGFGWEGNSNTEQPYFLPFSLIPGIDYFHNFPKLNAFRNKLSKDMWTPRTLHVPQRPLSCNLENEMESIIVLGVKCSRWPISGNIRETFFEKEVGHYQLCLTWNMSQSRHQQQQQHH